MWFAYNLIFDGAKVRRFEKKNAKYRLFVCKNIAIMTLCNYSGYKSFRFVIILT